jgi:hypothetical protein
VGQGPLIHEVSRSHTTTHYSRQDPSRRVISSSQRPLPDYTQQTQQTDIHVPGEIRTHNLSRRAAPDLCLRTRDRLDWWLVPIHTVNLLLTVNFVSNLRRFINCSETLQEIWPKTINISSALRHKIRNSAIHFKLSNYVCAQNTVVALKEGGIQAWKRIAYEF